MALAHSPSIVTSGLLAYVDPANSKCFTNSENLLTYSEDYSNAVWNKYSGQTTVTANQYIDPVNTFTADLITTLSDIGTHQAITTVIGLPYTASVYVLLGSGTTATAIMFRDQGGVGHHIVFNTSTGAVTQQANITNYGVINVGRGWYRFWMTYVADATGGLLTIRPDGQVGTTNMAVWGMQFENGALPSDYVSTTASIVNRSRTPIDLSGNGRTVALNPAVVTGPCPAYDSFTKSLVFNTTSNQSVNIGDFSYPAAWTDPFSASIWMYVPTGAVWASGATTAGFVLRGTYSGHHGLFRGFTDNVVGLSIRGTTTYTLCTATIARDAWYNIVGTWSGGNTTISGSMRVYVNGTLANTQTTSPDGVPQSANWNWGGNAALGGSAGTYYTGKTGPVMIYNKTLTDVEVKQNLNAIRGRFGV